MQPRWADFARCADGASLAGAPYGAGGAALTAADKAWVSSPVPPPPALVSRSDGTVTLQPRQWFPALSGNNNTTNNINGGGGGGAAVAYLRLFGKAAGSGTAVALSNKELPGTASRLPYDPATGCAPSVTVRDLSSCEAYAFAVAAYAADGSLVGGSIGPTTPEPIDAILPLPLPLAWAYLAQGALALGVDDVARAASQAVVGRLCSDKHRGWCLAQRPPPLTDAGSGGGGRAPSGNHGNHGSGDGSSGSGAAVYGSGNDGREDGDTPAWPFGRGPLAAGKHGGPLASYPAASLLFRPSSLARAPRSTLGALAQCLLVAAECARKAAPPLLAETNPDAGALALGGPGGTGPSGGAGGLLASRALADATSASGQPPLLAVATWAGCSSAAAQQAALVQVQRLGLCGELAASLEDWPLLQRAAHAAYAGCLRPLLAAARRGGPTRGGPHVAHPPSHGAPDGGGGLWRLLLAPLGQLLQALARVPVPRRSRTDLHLRTLLAAAFGDAALACGEAKAARAALIAAAPLPVLPLAAGTAADAATGSTAGSKQGGPRPGSSKEGNHKPGTAGAPMADGPVAPAEAGVGSSEALSEALSEAPLAAEPWAGTSSAQDALYAAWAAQVPWGAAWAAEDLRAVCGVQLRPDRDDDLATGGAPWPTADALVPLGYAGSVAAPFHGSGAGDADGSSGSSSSSRPGSKKGADKPKTPKGGTKGGTGAEDAEDADAPPAWRPPPARRRRRFPRRG